MSKINIIFPDGRQKVTEWPHVPRIGETVFVDKAYNVLDVVHVIEQNRALFGINIHLEVAMK